MNNHCIRAAIAATAFVVGAVAAAPSASAASFDGPWSVTVFTRAGACDPAYRYGIVISRGRVYYAGGAGVAISGRVTPAGAVSVAVASGGSRAVGSGRLARVTGSGTWRGNGPTGSCAGVWRADRG